MMSAMLPILEAFEEHGHTNVDPHITYAYVSPRSEVPAPVVEAARRTVELGGTRARALAPRVERDAEMFITISGGIAGDPAAVSRLVAQRETYEQWAGRGGPRKLRDEEVSFPARIVQLADVPA
jgi:hypothetical protein